MENKIDLSVILPIKSALAKDFNEFFEKAIKSIHEQKVEIKDLIVVHTEEEALVKFLTEFDFKGLRVKLIKHEGEPNYASQINRGIEESDSEWISFFEFDDEYSKIWFDNVKKYIDGNSDADGFLPIVVDIDSKNTFAGFTNEITFVAAFSSEIGVVTQDLLDKYQNFQASGMVIKREKVKSFGNFKSSIKLTFGYEFFLRMIYNSVKIITIPKIGYKHNNMREGSIFWNYKFGSNPLSPEEVKFWVELSKKEYFFTNDRNIIFEENA